MSALDPVKDWWNQASTRDQLMILICGVVVVVYLMYLLILSPVKNMAEQQSVKKEAQKAALGRVKLLAAQVKASKKSDNGQRGGRSIESIVESSISQNSLRVSGFDASGKSGIRVRFELVKFDNLLGWLYELEVTQGLRIKDLSIASGSEPGTVSANILIQRS